MRSALTCIVLLAATIAAACNRRAPKEGRDREQVTAAPRGKGDSALRVPRVVTEPTVVVFWLEAADTMDSSDAASAYDDLTYYASLVAPTLKANAIALVPTRADTIFVTLPNKDRRAILLSGLDFPYGYVLIDPGTPERILTGIYEEDDLRDELQAFFDLPDSTEATRPKITT
ncbi:MAG TPA: hypothetical protein VFK78_08875 [Gemmatimonadales bacterium]|nr:hypothetical protein [Gemmatimonadales bacterium]